MIETNKPEGEIDFSKLDRILVITFIIVGVIILGTGVTTYYLLN